MLARTTFFAKFCQLWHALETGQEWAYSIHKTMGGDMAALQLFHIETLHIFLLIAADSENLKGIWSGFQPLGFLSSFKIFHMLPIYIYIYVNETTQFMACTDMFTEGLSRFQNSSHGSRAGKADTFVSAGAPRF